MSPSELSRQPPPEVLAIAVALAVVWPGTEVVAAQTAADAAETRPASPWRWGGRRWERATSHRWS